MADKGWIKLDRDILENWIWTDKPYARGQAFIDLILSVNHKDKSIMFNGKKVLVKRGQVITSIGKLQQRWGWSRDKVYKFLKEMEDEGMVYRDSNNFRTLLTLVNYGVRQDGSTTHQTTLPTTHQTTHQTQTTMINNINNEKEIEPTAPVREKTYAELNEEIGDDW